MLKQQSAPKYMCELVRVQKVFVNGCLRLFLQPHGVLYVEKASGVSSALLMKIWNRQNN
jgi:hypothetical protein